jgi:methylmalonyl-CoA/ethylmalonyl-CoA epimerase
MIEDLAMITVAVRDAESAARGYRDMFGMQEIGRGEFAEAHLRFIMLSLGNTRLDFAEPWPDNERLIDYIDKNGEGAYLLGLQVADAAKAAEHVRAAGGTLARDLTIADGTRMVNVPPDETHGVTVSLIQAPPGGTFLLPPIPESSSGTIRRLHLHCIIVRDMDRAADDWARLFGTKVETVHEGEELGNKNSMVPLGSRGAYLEIMTPRTGAEDWAKQLDRRGESTFLIGVEVGDMDAVIEHIRSTGRRVVGEFTSKTGGRQAMVHPKDASGVMIELLQPAPVSGV